MYVKSQAKLTAKESKYLSNSSKYLCLFLCPGQYLVYFTAFSQLVRLPSWPRESGVGVKVLLCKKIKCRPSSRPVFPFKFPCVC